MPATSEHPAAKRARTTAAAAEDPAARMDAGSLPASVASLLVDYVKPSSHDGEITVKLASPDELRAKFAAAGCALPLAADQPPVEQAALLEACRLVLECSVRTNHPLFFNQLFGKTDPVAVCGEWITAACNTNNHTYEVAPVYTLLEREVLARFATALGGKFATAHDGLFVPGTSIGTLYGLLLARHRACPEVNAKGAAAAGRLVAFVSAEAHYSYLKSARVMGLGTDNLIKVAADASGAIDVAALRAAIAAARDAGGVPFFVGATAGTTVIGAFDPLRALRKVCDDEGGLWLHVDGAWGGAALLSPAHAHLCDGAGDADSFAVSLHKMLGATLQCSLLLTPHEGALKAANATQAAYLFQPDKLYAELDQGDKTIQCGRKPDAFKMWLMWKALGDAGLAARVDHAFALAAHATRVIDASDGALVLAYPPSCTNVCFWYVPERLRGAFPRGAAAMPPAADGALTPAHPIHAVAPRIKAALQKEGGALIGFQSVNGRPNFFRWVFASADTVTTQHVDGVLARIAALAEEAAEELEQ